MVTYYVYEVDRSRSLSIHEQGKTHRISEAELPPGYNDRNYEEEHTLIGKINAYLCSDGANVLIVLPNQEEHPMQDLYSHEPRFSIAETATMLGFSPNWTWQLIQQNRLNARRIGDIYVLAGADILAFSLLERPTGRPRSARQTIEVILDDEEEEEH